MILNKLFSKLIISAMLMSSFCFGMEILKTMDQEDKKTIMEEYRKHYYPNESEEDYKRFLERWGSEKRPPVLAVSAADNGNIEQLEYDWEEVVISHQSSRSKGVLRDQVHMMVWRFIRIKIAKWKNNDILVKQEMEIGQPLIRQDIAALRATSASLLTNLWSKPPTLNDYATLCNDLLFAFALMNKRLENLRNFDDGRDRDMIMRRIDNHGVKRYNSLDPFCTGYCCTGLESDNHLKEEDLDNFRDWTKEFFNHRPILLKTMDRQRRARGRAAQPTETQIQERTEPAEPAEVAEQELDEPGLWAAFSDCCFWPFWGQQEEEAQQEESSRQVS